MACGDSAESSSGQNGVFVFPQKLDQCVVAGRAGATQWSAFFLSSCLVKLDVEADFSGEPIGAKPTVVFCAAATIHCVHVKRDGFDSVVQTLESTAGQTLLICATMRLMRCCKRCSSTRYASWIKQCTHFRRI